MENYNRLMKEQLRNLGDGKPRLLLHVCCAVCAAHVLETLKEHFQITAFYYNPNIMPKAEHDLRLAQLRRLKNCTDLVLDDSGHEDFLRLTHGLEQEREGGARCAACIEMRLDRTARHALTVSADYFATSLTVSPHKNAAFINECGMRLNEKHGVKWLYSDFKKEGGYLRSVQIANELGLYKQSYCGCIMTTEEAPKRSSLQPSSDVPQEPCRNTT